MSASEDEFTQFAEAAAGQLLGTAYLLCGDWHTAEDLVQTTLAKVFASWNRIRARASAPAYARRTLVNTYFVDYRRRRWREVLSGNVHELPGRDVEPPALELRLELTQALATLPPKARAIVVLRYWEDMSIEQVAAHLGCSPGNVKSQSSRSLDKLRRLLDGSLPEADNPADDHDDIREGRDGRDATTSIV
jgi:RNA polymerase sigma-70 factor (sigma-E family)